MKVNNMTLGEAVRFLRVERKMTQADLANAMNDYSIPNISRFEKNAQTLPFGRLKEIATILGVNLSTLFAIAESDGKTLEVGPPSTCKYKVSREVPLISMLQAAAWYSIKDEILEESGHRRIETTVDVSKYGFALQMVGDSMSNPHGGKTIPEGSIIIIDPNITPYSGRIVVAQRGRETKATVRQLINDGDTMFLKPLNPAYPVTKIEGGRHLIGVARQVIIDLD